MSPKTERAIVESALFAIGLPLSLFVCNLLIDNLPKLSKEIPILPYVCVGTAIFALIFSIAAYGTLEILDSKDKAKRMKITDKTNRLN